MPYVAQIVKFSHIFDTNIYVLFYCTITNNMFQTKHSQNDEIGTTNLWCPAYGSLMDMYMQKLHKLRFSLKRSENFCVSVYLEFCPHGLTRCLYRYIAPDVTTS